MVTRTRAKLLEEIERAIAPVRESLSDDELTAWELAVFDFASDEVGGLAMPEHLLEDEEGQDEV